MTPKQKKIASKAPPRNKIDGKDLAVLRAEKAKGRGKGLQDEKMKPGKVMKAMLGVMAVKKAADKVSKKSGTPKAMGLGIGMSAIKAKKMKEILGRNKGGKIMKAKRGDFIKRRMKLAGLESGTGKGMGQATGYKKYLKGLKSATAKKSMKRIGSKALTEAAKAAKATRIGKIAAGVAGAALLAKAGLEKMYEKEHPQNFLRKKWVVA
jgi:hypothetical protein